MSRLASEFAKGLRGLKVKELAPYVGGFARSNLTPTTLYRRAYEHLHTATKAELDAGSVRPLFTTMGGLFVAAYVLAWPQVRDARGGVGGGGPGRARGRAAAGAVTARPRSEGGSWGAGLHARAPRAAAARAPPSTRTPSFPSAGVRPHEGRASGQARGQGRPLSALVLVC
jgi:hypothetical protein